MLKEGNKLNWTDERKQAFEKFKDFPLSFFDPLRQVNVATDASDKGCGGIAFHINHDGTKDIFAIHSMSFTDEQRVGWSINDKEAYAIFTACRSFEQYLLGRKFNLFTDHKNLLFLFKQPHLGLLDGELINFQLLSCIRSIKLGNRLVIQNGNRFKNCLLWLRIQSRIPTVFLEI